MEAAPEPDGTVLRLRSQGPARARPLIDFLAARAIPGLESAAGGRFRRNLAQGWVELSAAADPEAEWLEVRCSPGTGDALDQVTGVVRRVADLDTDLGPVAGHLADDGSLGPRLADVGVSRLPGTFDPFELAVRAVVGQQVSVAAARTLLGRLVALTGPAGTTTISGPSGNDTGHRPTAVEVGAFPAADAVAATVLDQLGMPASRRATITGLARAVADGRVDLGPTQPGPVGLDPDRLRHQLLALPGIGPWTAGYIVMRVVGNGDGWPSGDLVLRQSLGVTASELERRAERWRPWRSYAALVLWRTAPAPRRRVRSRPGDGPTGGSPTGGRLDERAL